jgi:hypothetical protein
MREKNSFRVPHSPFGSKPGRDAHFHEFFVDNPASPEIVFFRAPVENDDEINSA